MLGGSRRWKGELRDISARSPLGDPDLKLTGSEALSLHLIGSLKEILC